MDPDMVMSQSCNEAIIVFSLLCFLVCLTFVCHSVGL